MRRSTSSKSNTNHKNCEQMFANSDNNETINLNTSYSVQDAEIFNDKAKDNSKIKKHLYIKHDDDICHHNSLNRTNKSKPEFSKRYLRWN